MGFLGLGRKPVPGSVEDVAQLRAEVQGLHALVSSQSTRINALETRLLGGQPRPATPTNSAQVKSRTIPQPAMPGVSTGVPAAQPGLSAGDTLSPYLKVVGQLQLGAPLASAALSVHLPASKNSAVPRYGAAAEVSGRIHLFDSLGRPVAAVLGQLGGKGLLMLGAHLGLAFGIALCKALGHAFLEALLLGLFLGQIKQRHADLVFPTAYGCCALCPVLGRAPFESPHFPALPAGRRAARHTRRRPCSG